MKNKLISISIILVFLFTTLISTEASTPKPRLDLDDYEITVTNINNVVIQGTVSIAKGQNIALLDSTGKIFYNYTAVGNTGSLASFKLQVPAAFLKDGINTFKIKSLPVKDVIEESDLKTVTVRVNNSKKNQTLTASNITVELGKITKLNAKVDSGLPLTYISENSNIATVSANGEIVSRRVGTAPIRIIQPGNEEYNSISKTIIVTVINSSASTDNTYTIMYNGEKGLGSAYSQKVAVDKSVKLSPNRFVRPGYKFVGWATSTGRAFYTPGQHIETFKNVNMTHFQLGKVSYKNTETVKNLASKGKVIQLYAVWKGCGPQAAVDWGTLIAKDNNFNYGAKQSSNWRGTGNNRSHRKGCYFCTTNRKQPNGKWDGKAAKPWNLNKNYLSAQSKNQKYDKTYCCNAFVVACYVHGANEYGKCHGGQMTHDSWTGHNGKGKFKKISKSAKLQPGDVFFSQTHVWMCGNKNSKGKWTVIEASGASWKKSSIHVVNMNPKKRAKVKGRVRYYPNN